MTARPPGLEAIEALVWQTGTRDGLLVARIMRAIRNYAHAVDCPPEPGERAQILAAAAISADLDRSMFGMFPPTLAELVDPDGDGSEWWPR